MPTEQQLANRAAWLAALRSGDYPQTKQKLKNNQGFCCLGVACELGGVPNTTDSYGDCAAKFHFNGCNHYSVVDQTWFQQRFGVINTIPGVQQSLTQMLIKFNDEGGLSFGEIADKLENELFELHST